MMEEIKVTVSKYGPGRCLMLRWTDPETGKRKAKSAKTDSEKAALRAAGVLEKQLRAGEYRGASRTSWRDFTFRYCDERLSGLAKKTANQVNTVFATVERLLSPTRLVDVKATRLSYLAAELRREGKSEITIRNYLAHLKAAMRWAVGLGLLVVMPTFPKVQRAKGAKVMKGRPITAEEFERMLANVPKVLSGQDRKTGQKTDKKPDKKPEVKKPKAKKPEADPTAIASWRHYLTGLWWSGLRLRESLALSWEPRAGLSVDIAGKYPMLRIRGDAQKSGRDQLYPVAPEFGEMLLATPEAERRGRVFKLLGAVNPNGGPKDVGPVSDPDYISHVVCRIGEAAGVKVDSKVKRDRKTGEEREVVKYASAHDLRRSFGFRWSRRIMPAELRELMRHADIATTMRFYVGQDAESTADVLWAAYRKTAGNTFGNSGRDLAKSPSQETTQALDSQGLVQVHPTGLEPVTFGSVDRCSIQLS